MRLVLYRCIPPHPRAPALVRMRVITGVADQDISGFPRWLRQSTRWVLCCASAHVAAAIRKTPAASVDSRAKQGDTMPLLLPPAPNLRPSDLSYLHAYNSIIARVRRSAGSSSAGVVILAGCDLVNRTSHSTRWD